MPVLAPAKRAAVGRGEGDTNHWGKQESQLTGCRAKSPTFYRSRDPDIQGQCPTVYVVLVRLISSKTATSKQHRPR